MDNVTNVAYRTPSLGDVLASRDVQEAASDALEASLSPEQARLLEALMSAVEHRYRSGYWHLASQLAELLPGVGPAILHIADNLERRVDLTPPGGH